MGRPCPGCSSGGRKEHDLEALENDRHPLNRGCGGSRFFFVFFIFLFLFLFFCVRLQKKAGPSGWLARFPRRCDDERSAECGGLLRFSRRVVAQTFAGATVSHLPSLLTLPNSMERKGGSSEGKPRKALSRGQHVRACACILFQSAFRFVGCETFVPSEAPVARKHDPTNLKSGPRRSWTRKSSPKRTSKRSPK